MSEAAAGWIVNALGLYGTLGLAFAILFVIFGVSRVDESARGAGVRFRLLILPGVAALWPLLAVRWIRAGGHPPVERNAHRRAARTTGDAA